MKGVVYNLLERVVCRDHGEDLWDDVLEAAGLEGAYTSLGSYEDEQLARLLTALAERIGGTAGQLQRWLGEQALPLLLVRYPALGAAHPNTRAFLLALNDIIHPEVLKLYPGASVPEFGYEERGPQELILRYFSARRMCLFAEGLIAGTATHYAEAVVIDQPECLLEGAPECVIRCRWPGP